MIFYVDLDITWNFYILSASSPLIYFHFPYVIAIGFSLDIVCTSYYINHPLSIVAVVVYDVIELLSLRSDVMICISLFFDLKLANLILPAVGVFSVLNCRYCPPYFLTVFTTS